MKNCINKVIACAAAIAVIPGIVAYADYDFAETYIGNYYVKIDPVPVSQKGASGLPYTDVYASDIKAYCNGSEIKSYQIDGYTLIRPESIEADGISFSYNNETGILDINVEVLERK